MFGTNSGENVNVGWPGSLGPITYEPTTGSFILGDGGITIGSGIFNHRDRIQTIGLYVTGDRLTFDGSSDILFSSTSAPQLHLGRGRRQLACA